MPPQAGQRIALGLSFDTCWALRRRARPPDRGATGRLRPKAGLVDRRLRDKDVACGEALGPSPLSPSSVASLPGRGKREKRGSAPCPAKGFALWEPKRRGFAPYSGKSGAIWKPKTPDSTPWACQRRCPLEARDAELRVRDCQGLRLLEARDTGSVLGPAEGAAFWKPEMPGSVLGPAEGGVLWTPKTWDPGPCPAKGAAPESTNP